MIVYTCDILDKLKDKGYTSYRMRKERIFGENTIQKLRDRKPLSWHELDLICSMLQCQPGELIRYEETPDVEQ